LARHFVYILLGIIVRGTDAEARIVRALHWLAAWLIAAGLIAGAADVPERRTPATAGGYVVLEADFHNHSFPGDWSTIAPWDVILEARRAHLDVIALTGHNHVWSGALGHWLSRYLDTPIVLEGEEIVGPPPHYHLLGIGIHSTIGWRASAAEAVDEIHRQGGVAIAAHPIRAYSRSYDAAARQRLDGAEVLHPVVYERARLGDELRDFYSQGNYAAIGDSDYRGIGPAGICRTLIFARERSERGVLEAIRERHTVVYGQGRYYGDPALIELAKQQPSLIDDPDGRESNAILGARRIVGGLGLGLAVILGPTGFWRRLRKPAPHRLS
jgi:hypothetical protein